MKPQVYLLIVLAMLAGLESTAQETKEIVLRTHKNEINAVAYSPDGANIVAAVSVNRPRLPFA